MQPDTRYGYRAWDVRPGDNVDPTPVVAYDPGQLFLDIEVAFPYPGRPGPWRQPRFLGAPRRQPTVTDVVNLPPVGGMLLRDTETHQDSGMVGTSRPALGGI